MQTQQTFSFITENKKAWLEDARRSMRLHLRGGAPYVTSDTVWKYCPPPKYLNPKILGSVFISPDFESVGFTRTKRKSSHGRIIQKFRLKNGD